MRGWTPVDWVLAATSVVLLGTGMIELAVVRDTAVRAVPRTELPASPTLPGRAPFPGVDEMILAANANPFRADRSLPRVRYRPGARAGAEEVGREAKPERSIVLSLRLLGLAGNSAQRLAVLDGVPGKGGPRVYHIRDSVGPLVVKQISADRVTLSGPDTLIVLTILRPWGGNDER